MYSLARFHLWLTLDGDYHLARKVIISANKFTNNICIVGVETYINMQNYDCLQENVKYILIDSTTDKDSINSKFNDNLPKFTNLVSTLQYIGNDINNENHINIIGDIYLYEEIVNRYLYLCDEIHVKQLEEYDNSHYQDDIPDLYQQLLDNPKVKIESNQDSFSKLVCRVKHPEYEYLQLLDDILQNGETHGDRTGTGTQSLFGRSMNFDLRKGFPLITTKKTWFIGILRELLFFISGKTDTKILEAQHVNFWQANTSQKYLEDHNLPYAPGDMGAGYSFQWRHYGAKYEGCGKDYTGQGVDQLNDLIEGIKKEPFSRRHILNSWNPSDLDKMALPPCHILVQFHVGMDDKSNKYLDCMMFQRSGDMFLGVPFNIASYSILTHIIAKLTNLIPRFFVHVLGDCHIYLNHLTQVKEQLMRTPLPFSKLKVGEITDIDKLSEADFKLVDYQSWPTIKADMAV